MALEPSKTRCGVSMLLLGATAVMGCTGQIGPTVSDPTNGPVSGGPGPGPGGTGVKAGPCTAASFAPPRLWRLNDQQYANVVHDVFGPAITVPPDVSAAVSLGAEDLNSAQSLTIGDDNTVRNYMSSAHATAVSAVKDLTGLLGCATPDAACVQTFIKNKVARAFRRPVTDGEVQDMLGLYQAGATDSPSEGARVLMEYVLQSPNFLWRTELAGTNPDMPPPKAQPLGPYELAGALAFLFLDSAPDDTLWGKAAAGTLTKPDVLAAEVDRLMATPTAKASITNLIGSWLEVRKTEATVKDPMKFPEFTPAIKDALTQSLQLFLQDVVFGGKLNDLITSRKMFVNGDLAKLYGIAGVSGPALVSVDTTAPQWAGGILTQPALLAANAHVDRGDVVHRGLFIYSSMVCGAQVPDPPNNAAALNQTLPATATERDRANFRASRADCTACHGSFDPLGLLTERYDSLGRYQELDASGQPIDQTATIKLGNNLDGPANGIGDLITRLKSSRLFSDCTAGNLTAVAVGRTVNDDNSCALQKVQNEFAGSGSLTGLLRAIATSPAFTTRDSTLK